MVQVQMKNFWLLAILFLVVGAAVGYSQREHLSMLTEHKTVDAWGNVSITP